MEKGQSETTVMETDDIRSSILQSLTNPLLPDDVVFDILSRLPVKVLLEYRCVCKSWRSLISDPEFIKTHLRRSTKSRLTRLITVNPSRHTFVSCQISDRSWKKIQSPFDPCWYKEPELLCSSDGLLLLSIRYKSTAKTDFKSYFLWNPSIGAYKSLSCPDEISNHHITTFGLCYDSTNIDDYRVVIIFQNFQSNVLVVCSFKNNSWKKVEEDRYSMFSYESGVLVNGAPHWVMRSNNLSLWVIVRFDVVEEKLKEVSRPSFGDGGYTGIRLVELRGCLCVCGCKEEKQEVEIWAMMEYGKKDSWTNLIVIPNSMEPGALWCLKPLCFTKNGELLIEVGNREIVIYNPKDCTFGKLLHKCRGTTTYVESLVLLNGDDEVWRQQAAPPKRIKAKSRNTQK